MILFGKVPSEDIKVWCLLARTMYKLYHIACISQSCHSINPIQMVIACYYSGNKKEEKARLFSIKVCGAITQYKHGLKVHRANFLDSFFACKKEDLSSFSFGKRKMPLSKWANGYHTLSMKCLSQCLKITKMSHLAIYLKNS